MDDNLKLKLIELANNSQVEHFNRKKFLREAGWSEEKISDSEKPSDEIREHFLSMDLPVQEHLNGLWISSSDHYKWKIYPGEL